MRLTENLLLPPIKFRRLLTQYRRIKQSEDCMRGRVPIMGPRSYKFNVQYLISPYFRIGTFSITNFCSTTRSSARNIWVYLSQCTPSTTSTSWAAKRQAVLCCIVVEHQTNAALFKITNDKQITERTKECHVPTPNHDQPSLARLGLAWPHRHTEPDQTSHAKTDMSPWKVLGTGVLIALKYL